MSHDPASKRIRLLVSIILLVGFLALALLRTNLSSVNYSTNSWATTIQSGSLTGIAVAISIVFDTTMLLVFSLAAAALLFYRDFKKQSLLLLVAMGVEALFVSISKALVYSPRPPNELIVETGYSFPSGHVTSGLVFFGLLAYFAWVSWNSSKRKAGLIMFCLAITSIISLDRIYLNVHWFTDVLGGYLLGTFCMTFLIMVFNYLENSRNQLFYILRKKGRVTNSKTLINLDSH